MLNTDSQYINVSNNGASSVVLPIFRKGMPDEPLARRFRQHDIFLTSKIYRISQFPFSVAVHLRYYVDLMTYMYCD